MGLQERHGTTREAWNYKRGMGLQKKHPKYKSFFQNAKETPNLQKFSSQIQKKYHKYNIFLPKIQKKHQHHNNLLKKIQKKHIKYNSFLPKYKRNTQKTIVFTQIPKS